MFLSLSMPILDTMADQSTSLIIDSTDFQSEGPPGVGRTTAASINAGVTSFHLGNRVVNIRCGPLRNKELVNKTYISRVRATTIIYQQLGRDINIIARTDAIASLG
ncbi:hypothetical protein B0O99DRAFT_706146 [Bisporella sp. PMI_857]|nr:hypothetical protein B0O99DRAFT_706146 [Bisporella sp. PMI_857]